MSTALVTHELHCTPHDQQLQSHIESLLLLFLRDFCAEGANPRRSGYHSTHLQSVAQTFYVMQIVMCSAAAQRGQGTSNLYQGTSGITLPLSVCTERDLYYRNPPLFSPQGQRAAHASVERLCHWLEVIACVPPSQPGEERVLAPLFRSPCRLLVQLVKRGRGAASRAPLYTRESLGVTAAGKSLLVGGVLLEMSDPVEVIDVSARGPVGITLTYSLAARMVGCREVGSWCTPHDDSPLNQPWKLVLVEKESTHHALLQSMEKMDTDHMRTYVLLCTKGYPCIATRQWLRRAHALWPTLQLYVMVDGDPHGLCIALTLMGLFGPKGCPAPATAKVEQLLPLRFLGLRPSLLWNCNIDDRKLLSTDRFSNPTLSEGIPLTADDVQVLKRISATVQATLTAMSTTARPPRKCSTAIVHQTLQDVLKEAEWMQRAQIKCELQLACCPLGPLTFMRHNVARCDAELSEVC